MTREEIKAKFPNASESFINANLALSHRPTPRSHHQASAPRLRDQEATPGGTCADGPLVEQSPRNGALEPALVQKGPVRNVLVRVKTVRKRLLDEDNINQK